MASRLDQEIARLATTIQSHDWKEISNVAADVASRVKSTEVAKLPDRWYPKLSAKAAGAADPHQSWPRDWFEAIVEILYEKASEGLPGLLELWGRDKSTYPELVGLRLARLAAKGVESESISLHMRERLPQLHMTAINRLAGSVVHFSNYDPQPLAYLRSFSEVPVKDSTGVSLGDFISQHESEIAG